jgi:hypothetical protein
MPVIPALGRLKQEDIKFKAILGYLVRPFLKKPKWRKKRNEDVMLPFMIIFYCWETVVWIFVALVKMRKKFKGDKGL